MVSGASPRITLPGVNSLVVQGDGKILVGGTFVRGRPYLVIRTPAERLPNWVRAGV